jgi:hypothetical protein
MNFCINVSSSVFECCHPADPLNQRVFDYLDGTSTVNLTDSVSRAGSIYNRTVTQSIGFTQLVSEWYRDSGTHAIGFTQVVVATVDRPASASHTIGFTHSFTAAGTCIHPPTGVEEVPATFDSDTKKGMAVYASGSGTVDLAQADAAATARCVGLATADVAAAGVGAYQTEGTITQSDWTLVTGSATLTPGVYYYLSESTPGQLTTTAPTTITEYVVAVGRALSTTQLDIEIAQPILL